MCTGNEGGRMLNVTHMLPIWEFAELQRGATT